MPRSSFAILFATVTSECYAYTQKMMRILSKCTGVVLFIIFFSVNASAGIFDTLKNIKPSDRINVAEQIYQAQLRLVDSTYAINEINNLILMAGKTNDHSLECFGWSLLADRLARTRGFNDESTSLHFKAIGLAIKYELPLLQGICSYKAGRYFYSFKKFPSAFEYLLKADAIFKDQGYSKSPLAGSFLYFMANIYFETGDLDNAAHFYMQSLSIPGATVYQLKQTNNTLGVIALRKNDYPRALVYMQKVLAIADADKDSTWKGIISGNIGSVYFKLNNFQQAISYLQTGYRLNLAHNEWSNAVDNISFLVKIYLSQNNTAAAATLLKAGEGLIQKDSSLKNRRNLYEVMAMYNEKTLHPAEALEYWKKQQQANDSINLLANAGNYNTIQQKVETEKHLADIKNIQARSQIALLKRNLFIVILFLLMVVSLLVYNRLRLKRKMEWALFIRQEALLTSEKLRAEAETLRAEDELVNAKALLKNYTENTRQKNELIKKFSVEIDKLKRGLPSTTGNYPQDYEEQLLQSTILTDVDWDDFRLLFEKVHKGFFFNLKKAFPQLSVTDTRLLSLIKLQLSNREMANMLGITTEAIRKAKQRLRKKINSEQEVEDIVATL